jgi:hypothetical protein
MAVSLRKPGMRADSTQGPVQQLPELMGDSSELHGPPQGK